MRRETELTEVSQIDAADYGAHYTDHHRLLALARYRDEKILRPHDRKADFSRMQARTIIAAVGPSQELLDSQMELAVNHLERNDTT